MFSSGQHDSHEFMAYLLNIFHESINQAEMTNQEVFLCLIFQTNFEIHIKFDEF